jgi:hypothetical protein
MLSAYDPNTHREIAREAFKRSDLVVNPDLLIGLGLNPEIRRNRFPNSYGVLLSIDGLIQDGAQFEDTEIPSLPNDTETYRMKHHFYDPQNNGRPLTFTIPATFTTPEFEDANTNDSYLSPTLIIPIILRLTTETLIGLRTDVKTPQLSCVEWPLCAVCRS